MDKMIELIKNKAKQYRPIPFWSWNDQLEPDVLKRQIHWMQDNGIGGFFMHARGGLKTPYLSEEWMQCIDVCCKESEKLGMEAWAYDENGWPSGFCGGKLLENESNRDMYIIQKTGAFDEKADVSYCLGDTRLVRASSGEDGKEYLNLYLHRSTSTVDILNPEVVDQFLESTHEQYKNYFGEEFQKKIKGFFTDEPQYYRVDTPYTPMLRKYFQEQYGEEIFDGLGLLFVEKEGYRTFRYRYWLGMQKLMLENFAKRIYDWCEENQISLTGHYVEEVTMGMQLMCCAGVMPFYEYEHIPGIDWLGQYSKNELSPRQLGSVAQQLGKKHVLTETFGCCGWDITPGDLKRVAEFQYVSGVNRMCHHLVPYSEHGQRKRDFPAHFAPINPWVKEGFKKFNDYFTNLGCLLGESEEVVNVAMLHPMRSAYFDYQRSQLETGFGILEVDEKLQEACRILSSRGIAYHFLDETLMEKYGFVEADKIGCGKCTYNYLVIPKIYTMGAYTEQLLRSYINHGGKVLLLDEKPFYLEGESYNYSYLNSNCTLKEIMEAQPYHIENTENNLYYTYRKLGETTFLFVQNASEEKEYTQTFHIGEEIKSFEALDLQTLEKREIPLTVSLPANGSLLLFPSNKKLNDDGTDASQKALKKYELQFENAEVHFDMNYLTLDMVRYSKDGQVYSEPMLRNRLFDQLLKERYEGKLWIAYDFEIQDIPENLTILAEKGETNTFLVNGKEFQFEKSWEDEPAIWMADISEMVQVGMNSFEMCLHWHQSEETYYALFGENVTESLKNCIAYDSEIEDVYLAGKFGVYSHENYVNYGEVMVGGSSFYIGKVPKQISEPTTDGLPFFRGKMTLNQKVFLETPDILLEIRGRYSTAKVRMNGKEAGMLFFERQLDVSKYAVQGENQIEVEFFVGNRNLFGPFHSSSMEEYIYPTTFEAFNLPESDSGCPRYKLHRFYKVKEKK